jgi:hypothetical protein
MAMMMLSLLLRVLLCSLMQRYKVYIVWSSHRRGSIKRMLAKRSRSQLQLGRLVVVVG